ncbi:ATP-dependent RNA helicase dbp9 [Porphyridium purpureum]|uniref:RNA helicase n=1 Tax=Porphyridium purpureum TaxID=35688 RepID=A0A5J4YVS5_PORPP|nr:ATP-dependent RNA helicase dbp9 [Porphyridium purpureum]|eukprot:POR5421..scf227_4
MTMAQTAAAVAAAPAAAVAAAPEAVHQFNAMLLDARVQRGIRVLGFETPTDVQAHAIPAALAGRDVLVAAPTGSGKTAAYAIPLVDILLKNADEKSDAGRGTAAAVHALVLVPTRDLAAQVTRVLKALTRSVGGLTVSNVKAADNKSSKSKKRSLRRVASAEINGTEAVEEGVRVADILVGTPAAILALASSVQNGGSLFSGVEFVVVDEADLVLSYGFGQDTTAALSMVPTSAQAMLVSATLDEDVEALRTIVLRRPLAVRIEAETGSGSAADSEAQQQSALAASCLHYFVGLQRVDDKFLVTYAMLRLGVLTGKILVFVNGIDAAFKLKLFLDRFSISSAVLNSELPANSRLHCIEGFNASVFDILLIADEIAEGASAESVGERKDKRGKSKSKKANAARDADFGAVRGLDFRNVSYVLNFDLPRDGKAYTHRAGRTARAGRSGTVLSLAANHDEQDRITELAAEAKVHINSLLLQSAQIEAFRYRVEDCLRSVTKQKIRDARLQEVKRELLNSVKLKAYFEENPDDLAALRHDRALEVNRPAHLAHVPNYLLPPALRADVATRVSGMSRNRNASKHRSRVMRDAKRRRGNGANPTGGVEKSVQGRARGRGESRAGGRRGDRDPLKSFAL